MATDSPAQSSGTGDGAAERLSRLNRKLEEAHSATLRAKNIGRLMSVLVVIAALIGVWILFAPIKKAFDNPEPYQAAFQKELEETILPKLREELESEEFRAVLTEIGENAGKTLEARQEEIYAAIDGQIRLFIDNLSEWGGEQLHSRQDRLETHIQQRLYEVLPELQDEEVAELVIANAAAAMEEAIDIVMDRYLGQHIQHLVNLQTQIEQFPVPTHIAAMTEEELVAALQVELGEYAMSVFLTSINPAHTGAMHDVHGEIIME